MAGELEGVMVTQEGLDAVISHVRGFGKYDYNEAMLTRLSNQLGSQATGADANFYVHELTESELMASGMSYQEAHDAALLQAQVSPFSLYAPEVIEQFPGSFNSFYRNYWGLP
jgi:filamentous hemagglutinin